MASPVSTLEVENSNDSSDTLDLASVTIAAGEGILVAVALIDTADATDVSSVTIDPGGGDETSLTKFHSNLHNWQANRVATASWWGLENPPDGTFTIRIVSTAAAGQILGAAFTITGHDTTDMLGPNFGDHDFSVSDSPTASVTTTADDSLVMGCLVANNDDFAPVAPDQTEIWERTEIGGAGDAAAWAGEQAVASASTSQAISGTATTARTGALSVIEILAEGGAPPAGEGPYYTGKINRLHTLGRGALEGAGRGI